MLEQWTIVAWAWTKTAALAGLLLAIVPTMAWAEADGPDFYKITGVKAGAAIALRAGPATAERRIGVVPHDAVGLRNLGCQGGMSFAEWEKASERERERAKYRRWCKVDYQGRVGWLAGRFLIEDTSFKAVAAAMPGLAGVTWTLVSADGKPAAGKAWISFGQEGRVLGNSGCNIFRGSAKIGEGSVEIAPLAATKRACRDETVSAQEALLFSLLRGKLDYRLDSDGLVLVARGGAKLSFARTGKPPS